MFWFYNPTNARPLDIWPWYIWTIGLPLEKARAFIGLYGGILISLFLVSTTFFVAAFRRASRTL
jgi:voltage-gated potassium channel Kch